MPELDDGVDGSGTSTAGAGLDATRPNLGAAGSAELTDELADLITATSGVLRIEPTLRGAVHAWRSGDDDEAAQHLEVTARGRMVDVSVHLAVSSDQQARLLAHRLRERLQEHLRGRGLEAGTVEISILVIEPAVS